MILTSKRPIVSFVYDNYLCNDNINNEIDNNEIEYNAKKRLRISPIYYDNNIDLMPLNSMYLTNNMLLSDNSNISMNIENSMNIEYNSNSNDEYRTTTNMSILSSSNNLKPKLTDYFKPISNQPKTKQFCNQEIFEYDVKCEYCNVALHDHNEMLIDSNNNKANKEQLNSTRCSFCNRLCCNNTTCISLCEKCGYKYCKFCCTLNYDYNYERLLCIDCNLD